MLEVIEDGDMEDWVKVHKNTHTHTDVLRSHRCALWVAMPEWLPHEICVLLHTFGLDFSCRACFCSYLVCVSQARNKTGSVGYVPEKYLQFPTSNSLLSMLQSLATLDARSHTSSNSTEPELHSGCVNGDTNSKCAVSLVVVNYSSK